MKIESDDLKKTRELCRRPGVLKEQMQESYRVVRDGIEVEVPRRSLSYDERVAIVEEIRGIAARAVAESDALAGRPTIVR